MEDKRTMIEELIDQTVKAYKDAEAGSDEAEKLSKDLERFYRLYLEDIKNEEFLFNDQAAVERANRELEMRMSECRNNEKWYRRVKPDTMVTCGTVIFMGTASIVMQLAGHMEPKLFQTMLGKVKL